MSARPALGATEFGATDLAGADVLLLLPVYGARETQEQFPGVTSALLAELVRARGTGTQVHLLEERAGAAAALHTLVRGDDLVLTVGAGDVTTVGPELLELLGENPR